MADFCKLCAIEMFGEDTGDLADISKPEDTAKGLYACVLCESCGPIQVNHLGECITPWCYEKHGERHG